MKFEEWFEANYGKSIFDASFARKAWNACLEHDRIGFLEREMEHITDKVQDGPAATSFDIGYHESREDFYRWLGAAYRYFEYLKEQAEKDKE